MTNNSLHIILYTIVAFTFVLGLIFNRFILFTALSLADEGIFPASIVVDEIRIPQYYSEYINPLFLSFDLEAVGSAGDYQVRYIRDRDTMIIGKTVITDIQDKEVEVNGCGLRSDECSITVDGGEEIPVNRFSEEILILRL